MEKLELCPFCVGKAAEGKPMFETVDRVYWVEYTECGADGPMTDTSQDEANQLWNKRT